MNFIDNNFNNDYFLPLFHKIKSQIHTRVWDQVYYEVREKINTQNEVQIMDKIQDVLRKE